MSLADPPEGLHDDGADRRAASGRLLKGAAVAAWIAGLGFGLPCLYAIWVLVETDRVAMFLGFPTYGDGPFVAVGIETTVPLLMAFLAICAAETVAGALLWRGRRSGIRLALGLLPLELVFWIGFALPFGPLLGVVRTLFVAGALMTARPDGDRSIDARR